MTVTIEETDIDTSRIETLDFDHAVPCEWNRSAALFPECSVPAEWKVVFSCCGRVGFLCQPHFDRMLEKLAENKALRCSDCLVLHAPPSAGIASATKL